MWSNAVSSLSDLALVRLPALLNRCGTSRSAVYKAIADGLFVPPVRVGGCAAWPSHEIDTLIAAKIAGATSQQLCQLVRQLKEQRSTLMPPIEAA
jgi:predicted DNA-binding transcriptional regulator AlpA